MNTGLYLSFVLVSAVVIVTPGPNVLLMISTSTKQGAQAGFQTMSGVMTAMAAQLIFAALSVTSLVLILADWFVWLRWLGVLYLIYLGFQQIMRPPDPARKLGLTANHLFWQGFFVSLTNPKTMLFFVAFIPQFIDMSKPVAYQTVVLSGTFFTLVAVLDSLYILLADRLRRGISGYLSERGVLIRDRISGSILIGVGVLLGLADVKTEK